MTEEEILEKSCAGVYPTTQIVTGEITIEEFIKSIALYFYEEMVCDYRLEPKALRYILQLGQIEFKKQHPRQSLLYEGCHPALQKWEVLDG